MLKHTQLILFSLTAMCLIGCESKDKNPMGMKFSDTYLPDQRVITDQKQQPPVVVGMLPQAYFVQFSCTVRVAEMSSKKTLVSVPAAHGDYVSIDAKGGIRVGPEQVMPGPLDGTKKYGIYLDDR